MTHAHHPDRIFDRLASFPGAIRAACMIVAEDDALWTPPGTEAWSIAQIALHLLLEERQDFRPRLLSTIADPGAPWAPIDPETAVAERWGIGVSLGTILDDLERERANSMVLLRALPRGDESLWSRTHQHPTLGAISAAQLLACWAAHDALHLRQIAKRLHQLATRDAAGLDLSYAGAL